MAVKKLESVPVEALIPYARNARKHSDEQVAQLAASIREFGFNNPVLVDKENGIIAGHGRVLAARKLGLEAVPCLRLDHLTETQRKAYILADNRLAELGGGWDEEMLAIEIKDLASKDFDMTLAGWTQAEVSNLFLDPNFEPGTEDDQGKLDEKSPVICPKCTHEFHP
jgi:ParB-like chromosome segregation protein Spo0J